eukprot:3338318-Amphidinium_carterae.2
MALMNLTMFWLYLRPCLGHGQKWKAQMRSLGRKKDRKIEATLSLPVGSFLGEGHGLRGFRRADNGLEIGVVCMSCGAYSAGHWGLLKFPSGQQLAGRTAQMHRIQSGRFPDNKVKCPVVTGLYWVRRSLRQKS